MEMVEVQSKPRKRLAARFTRSEVRHMEKLLLEGKDELSDLNFHQKLADKFKIERVINPVRHMEKLLLEGKDELSDLNFHQKLADKFNARGRAEKKSIQMQQVQRWFLSRLKAEKITDDLSPIPSKELSPIRDEVIPDNAIQCFELPDENCDEISEGLGMEFEAKSYRDQAWYDVSTFLAHRVLSTGEVEVRVRFFSFGPEEDEWVNVRQCIRDRSIPMEPSECWRVKEGDTFLCFREKDDGAYHFDARVIAIERTDHDIMNCSCTFLVRYDHDQIEETVHLNHLCRRP